MVNNTPESFTKTLSMLVPDDHAGGTVTGVGKDVTGFNEALVILDCGALVGSGTFTFALEESDAVGGTYTAITGGAWAAIDTGSTDSTLYTARVRLAPRKAFIRVVGTKAGTVSAFECAVTITLMSPQDSASADGSDTDLTI